MKWKDRLLSSSIPLEYEVASILASEGFSTNFDYTYHRLDEKEQKEFSVDIHSTGYHPFRENAGIKHILDVLVECKYRNPNVKWVFLPDINTDEFHNFSSRGVLKVVDEFSEFTYKEKFGLPIIFETCLKGIEVNFQSGDVHETGIIHGAYQLIYSIPHILRSHIYSALNGSMSEAYPFSICPILLTTAELFIVNETFDSTSVSMAEDIDNIASKIDCLKLYLSIPPSFRDHCRNVFTNISSGDEYKTNLNYINQLRHNSIKDIKSGKFNSNPQMLLSALTNGFENDFFREIIVCNKSYFPTLLKSIKKSISFIEKNKKKLTV